MTFRLVRELAGDGVSVAVGCRVLKVSRSGYHAWSRRPPSARAVADEQLTGTIVAIHEMSPRSYGAPRVHAELRLGMGVACGRKRVARLMRSAGISGIAHRRKRGRHHPAPAPHADLVTAAPLESFVDGTADVVVTDHDRPELGHVLRDVLALPARWVGVMGSPREAPPHVPALRDLGVDQATIDRVHRPIGLNIGSRTPAEIAVAALAGLIADRTGSPGGFTF